MAVAFQPKALEHPAASLPGVLMLAYYFPPANFIGAARPFRFAKYLRRLGYSVSVVTTNHASDLADGDGVLRRPGPVPAKTAIEIASVLCSKVQRFLLPYNEQLPWLPHAVAAGSEMIVRHSPRIIYSTSPPLATQLAALVLKWRYGLKWVADFRDPLVGNPCRTRRFTSSYDSALEHLIFSQADVLIAVTDVVADSWRKRYPQWASKIQVIWNGFDPEDAVTAAPIPARPYRTMAHVGNMYAGRSPHRLLASFERLIRAGQLDPQAVRVRFIGPSDQGSLPLDRPPASTLMTLGCLEYHNHVIPRADALRTISESDYLLILEGDARGSIHTVPGKLFEYIPVGRPILALTAQNSPLDRILSQSGLHFACLYPEDTDATIDAKVLCFLESSTDPVTPSSWFRTEFDGAQQALKLAHLLERLPAPHRL